jgi:acyl-coenzyme A thioesterase PaaI-like protein
VSAGRTLGTADVEITAWDDPERLVAVGRARFIRATP